MRPFARAFLPVLTVVAACVGCGPQSAAPPIGWPTVLPAFTDMVQVALSPSWTGAVSGPSSLDMASDASVVAGAGPSGPWAFTSGGTAVPLPGSAAGSSVTALPAGRVGVGPGASDPPGQAELISSSGAVLWTGGAVGPVTMAGSTDGRRVAVLDAGTADGTLLTVGASSAVPVAASGLAGLGDGAQAQFDLPGDLLVSDASAVEWIPAGGGPSRWVVRTGTALSEQLAVNPTGTAVAVASVAGDNTLFEFGVSGSSPVLQWSEPLAAGGSDQLLASGDRVLVWDLGGVATLAAYRASDGAMLWQDSLPQGTLEAVALGSTDTVVALVDGCSPSQHCLLFLSPAGAAEAYAPLPQDARVSIASDGAAAAAVVPGAGGRETLLWWSLSEWAGRGAGGAETSSS